MRRPERLIACSALAVSLLALAGHTAGFRIVAPAGASSTLAAAPDAARIATCDIYQLVERMVESPQYTPARDAEQTAWGTWKLVNFRPSLAIRSRFGVCQPLAPNGPMSA